MATHLPVLPQSSLRADGSRAYPYPADVRGRFATARKIGFAVLIAIWALLPWTKIAGNPAVFLDIPRRRFYLFGGVFNSQDIWLLFFVMTGVAFALVYTTATLGRAWCGWACPQTVFLEFLYRPVERLIEGPRDRRMKLDAAPWSAGKLAKKVAKHAIFVAIAFVIAHMFLAYFVTMPGLWRMVRGAPSEHPEAFGWAMGVTGVLWFMLGFFREQVCLIICPYGRLQAVLVDEHSIAVGYDTARGEPRMKAKGKGAKADGAGDCIDCRKCVHVCPTNIDIRNGIQLDCIACTACIDACDDVMDKLGRPRGLVRYDSLEGLVGRKRKFIRPRVVIYTFFGLLGLAVATFATTRRTTFEANLIRIAGPPFVTEDGVVRNAFHIHLVNKRDSRETFTIEPDATGGLSYLVPLRTITLEPMAGTDAAVFVTAPAGAAPQSAPIRLKVLRQGETQPKLAQGTFLGPAR